MRCERPPQAGRLNSACDGFGFFDFGVLLKQPLSSLHAFDFAEFEESLGDGGLGIVWVNGPAAAGKLLGVWSWEACSSCASGEQLLDLWD